MRSIACLVGALYVGVPSTATGLTPQALSPGDTVITTPRDRYPAGWLKRLVLGDGNRELWATPVPAVVLDLQTFAGGITPTRRGGGLQTSSLRFEAPDGREFTFRSIDKDASRTLDPRLRETIAARFVQDQIAALFPLSAMVVAPLLEAGGVLYAKPTLAVMPDDPALGEFREDFAGVLGWIEERPNELPDGSPGFADADRIVGSPRLLERLEEEGPSNRLDAESFLRARLMDALVGDWDRHPDQWRWAGDEHASGAEIFRPIPRDRDWALSRLDGLLQRVTWVVWPNYVGFDTEYPPAFRLTYSGRALDRRFLPALEWDAWERVVTDLERRLTDEVIEDAVGRLPDSYLELVGEELVTDLTARRDDLRRFAREFYELLAGWVDVHLTDEDEIARVERLVDGRVRVEVRLREEAAEPHFRRTFLPSETHEVRVRLRGGNDEAVVSGTGDDDIVIRVVGGGSRDRLVDRTDGDGVHLYDGGNGTEFIPADGTGVHREDWEEPIDVEETTHQAPARDWGSRWLPLPAVGFDPDVGFFVGGGAQGTFYGFRHYPYRSRLRATVGLGTATFRPRANVELDLPFVGDSRAVLELSYEGAELTKFFGLGNETRIDREREFFEARRARIEAGADLRLGQGELTFSAGPRFFAVRPDEEFGTLVERTRPYGQSNFEGVGLRAGVTLDTRDDPSVPRSGVLFDLETRWVPAALDAVDAYGGVAASVRTFVSGGGRLEPTLALRLGGEKTWGTVPFFDAPTLGGTTNLRGFRRRRFTGDASLYGAAELRVFLTEVLFILPGDLGLLAFTDVGRVFLDGEDSERWHAGAGGGLWITFLDEYALSLSVARSSEETTVSFGVGLTF